MAAGEPVLQLKVSLVGASDPPVWRRVLVPARMRLDRLHDVIQAAMGWEDYHLHAFTAGDVDYGPPDPDGPPDPELGHRDERRTAVGDVIGERRDRMRYVYDFGDHWRHDVVVEKVLTAEPGSRYPSCLTGKGRCPPEDCGGVWGYAELRETLADPTHEDHAQMLEWLGIETAAQFDPHAFHADEVNAVLGGRVGVA
ncbi:MAG TPA: plasmid pRiA4b ORF-3 family protein [Gaiellaceae bacterium]|nr:plasmid pRiA4b ORF-3 family protein [Gaiellaceae bacterium]